MALDCLHEAAEDFLVEFVQDAYICASHAKRITLMEKDFITLRRLRYRFSKLLEPLPITDEKTYNILNIPPYRKPKPEEATIKIEEVTHERDTKKARHAESMKEEALLAKRKEEFETDQQEERDKRILYESQLPDMLDSLNPEGFVVRAYSKRDLAKREDYTVLDRECMVILKNKQRELNDTLVLATLRYSS